MDHQASYEWSTSIEKLMTLRGNSWVRYSESKLSNLTLRLHCDQLLISSESQILESLNMNTKLKGAYKDDILILIVGSTGNNLRKIRFQIKASVVQCFQILGQHFPVMSYKASKTCTVLSAKYRNIEEVFKDALTKVYTCNSNVHPGTPLPSEYRNFIRLCLLDPDFPHVVKETEKMLKETY